MLHSIDLVGSPVRLGRLFVLAVTAAACPQAEAQLSPLFVDFQPGGSTTFSDATAGITANAYEATNRDPGSLAPVSYNSPGEINATIEVGFGPTGQTNLARFRALNRGGTGNTLLNDWLSAETRATDLTADTVPELSVTISGLAAGSYTLTTFHRDNNGDQSGIINYELLDASGMTGIRNGMVDATSSFGIFDPSSFTVGELAEDNQTAIETVEGFASAGLIVQTIESDGINDIVLTLTHSLANDTDDNNQLDFGIAQENSSRFIVLNGLSISNDLPGDYNDDGVVNAADYTVWRDQVGNEPGSLPNDITGLAIGEPQRSLWAGFYGASIDTPMPAAVPEPSTLLLAIATTVAMGRAGRRG